MNEKKKIVQERIFAKLVAALKVEILVEFWLHRNTIREILQSHVNTCLSEKNKLFSFQLFEPLSFKYGLWYFCFNP